MAAVLRRSSKTDKAPSADMLCYKTLALDIGRKKCMVDGCEVKLPRKEFEILATRVSSSSTTKIRFLFIQADMVCYKKSRPRSTGPGPMNRIKV